ncbi:MAG: hypothetical protein RLZZ415_330 [Pseudomonadota bacterium]
MTVGAGFGAVTATCTGTGPTAGAGLDAASGTVAFGLSNAEKPGPTDAAEPEAKGLDAGFGASLEAGTPCGEAASATPAGFN